MRTIYISTHKTTIEHVSINFLPLAYQLYRKKYSMPRTEYRALTIRVETYDKIVTTVHRIKKKKPRMYTSDFLEMLLDMYEKNPNRIK